MLERLRVNADRLDRLLTDLPAVHTPPGTPVEIVLREGDRDILLVVSDHGRGVPEADRAELFEPFAQGPAAPAHQPGTGIGLSLVAAFAELHGGRVWIDDAPGGGAAFHVRLPSVGALDGELTTV